MASSSAAVSLSNLASCSSSSISGAPVLRNGAPSLRPAPPAAPSLVLCKSSAEESESSSPPPPALSRRSALSISAAALAIAAGVATSADPAQAAYGDAANIFAAPKKDTGFIPVTGDGFNVSIPSKWNPSKEQEFPGTVLRYEDNFDANSNLTVLVLPAEKSSIKDYGTPEKFLDSVSFLLGKQAYSGKTNSEGGFDPNAVAIASILESSSPTINGKDYYNISVLTRTADGDEGGKHQLIVASVSGGKLYVFKAQAGDKRWFKGAKKFVEGSASSFNVA